LTRTLRVSKKWFRLGFAAVFIIILGLQVVMPVVSASAEGEEVSWLNPAVIKSEASPPILETYCNSPYQVINVANELQPKSGCVVSGRDIRYGFYPDASHFHFVIGFANDSRMYPLNISGGAETNFYSASQDVLVMKQYLGGNFSSAGVINVYKDFSKSIVKCDDFPDSKTYKLSKSTPDYSYLTGNGSPWPVEELEMSENGNWAAFQLRNGGVSVLNIKTLEVKYISNYNFIYDRGINPHAQFAISNDGKYIAMMGLNLFLTIFKIDSECGSILKTIYEPLTNPCETINVNTGIYGNLTGWFPRFNENNGELTFFGQSSTSTWHLVVLRAKNYTPSRLDYVALGDSYSSGEGELNDGNYIVGTNVENEKCHLSMLSYAFRISYNLSPNQVKSVACSGAVTGDIVGFDDDYWGQGNRLVNLIPNKAIPQKNYLQSVASDTFLPGRIHQETFVKRYQPKVITVGVGGNDIGFADKLTACLSPATCSWAGTFEGREKTAVEMKGLFSKLVTTYQNLQKDSPDAKIYAIGYPRFIDTTGECSALEELLIDPAERLFIDNGIIYLNQIIEAAAKKVGIKYISIENSFGNHKVCGSSPQKAANFIKAGDDIGLPGEWLDWVKLAGQESFHPNALGHQLASVAILNAVGGDITSYNYCSNGEVFCPQDVSAPEPSEYWVPGVLHNYAEQKIADFVGNIAWLGARGALMNLKLIKYSLQPGMLANIEINSTPRSLGQFVVADDGSLESNIELPADLEEGFHTIHIYGKSYSGEDVDLYQVIKYFKPEPVVEDKTPTIIDNKVSDSNVAPNNSTGKKSQTEKDTKNTNDIENASNISWTDDISDVGYLKPSILSSNTAKKSLDIKEENINKLTNDALASVIAATFCALLVSILAAITIRFYRK